MPRSGQNPLRWDSFVGGIQQAPERARGSQVLDARNVWAPDGVIERRPGQQLINDELAGSATKVVATASSLVLVGHIGSEYTWLITSPPVTPPSDAHYYLGQITAPTLHIAPSTSVLAVDVEPGYPALTDLVNAERVFNVRATWDGITGTPEVLPDGHYTFYAQNRAMLLARIQLTTGIRYAFVGQVFTTAGWTGGLYFSKSLLSFTDAAFLNVARSGNLISTIAVLPIFDVALVTYANVIYAFSDAGIVPAVVNTDPDLVGPRTADVTPTYSVDVIPQLSSPPRANVIYYFKGFVFALQNPDEPYAVRWSAPVVVTGPNLIWPSTAFENLDDQDGLQPKAILALHEQPVIYKLRSITILVLDAVDSATGLPTFAPTRVVTGIGSEAANGIVEVQGQHFFPALDGFYAFNGGPKPDKLSLDIDPFYRRLGRAALAQAKAVDWAAKHCVLWTVPQLSAPKIDNKDDPHYVILYDYANKAWWIWENVAASILGLTFVGQQSVVGFATSSGRFGVFNGFKDFGGDQPAAWFLTQRLGEATFITQNTAEIWAEATTHADEAQIELLVDDDSLGADPMNFTSPGDVVWGGTTWGGSVWQANKRRERYLTKAVTGHHFQLKVTLTGAFNRAWKFIRAMVSLIPLRRR